MLFNTIFTSKIMPPRSGVNRCFQLYIYNPLYRRSGVVGRS